MRVKHQEKRKGAVVVKTALLLIPMMAMLSLAVDYGFLLKVRTDLQRSADLAALAGVRDLVPDANGNQNPADVRATVKQYADANIEDVTNFKVLDSDIEIGRYDPSTIYSSVTILNDGVFDTVRVTVRRDAAANSRVSLFFSRVLGITDSAVTATATAILQKASTLRPGNGVLPFAVGETTWDSFSVGQSWKVYGNGHLKDLADHPIPGNWGTVDLGDTNNSTSDISDQIEHGLRPSDLDELYHDGRISNRSHIDTSQSMLVQGETGLSSGLRTSVEAIEGQVRYIPIFNTVTGSGNSANYTVVGWGAIRVRNSNWQGNANTWIRFEKTYTYELNLVPHGDLSDTSGTIEGVFTAAVLVQ